MSSVLWLSKKTLSVAWSGQEKCDGTLSMVYPVPQAEGSEGSGKSECDYPLQCSTDNESSTCKKNYCNFVSIVTVSFISVHICSC